MKKLLFILLSLFAFTINAQKAVDFNGNNWVQTDPIVSLNDFTIEFDVRIEGSGTGSNYQRFLSTFNNGMSIAVDPLSGNNIRIYSADFLPSWTNTSTSLIFNTWYHMAWVKQGTQILLYIDGTQVWATGCTGSPLNASAWYLGANQNNFSENANCSIDNFRIWNDVRTPTEISDNYQTCISAAEANLIVMYDFEEGSGTTTSDIATTDGSQNGTLVNSPQWSLEGFSCNKTRTLAAGDIAIIGINSDNFSASVKDDFTFITLSDIPEGEVVYFTADGWGGSSWAASNGGGHYSWTAPAGGAGCGTVVHVYMTATLNTLASSTGTITGPYSGLPSTNYLQFNNGDQILMYQASSAGDMNPTFITAITSSSDNTNYNASTSWNNTDNNASGYSVLPSGLTNGVNCVSLYPNPSTTNSGLDNSKYTGTLTGTSTALRAAINDYTNWSGNDATPYDISPGVFSPSVTCLIPPVLVTSIAVQGQGGATNVLSGSSLQMLATVLPANATDGSVTWSVTNGTGTATINPSTGMLTGGSPGTVTVFATSNDGSGIQGSTVITVDPVLVTSMGVQGQGGASNVLSGSSLQMLATVLPANATDGSVTWSVTNGTGTATINPSTGMLTGGSPGTVTVFATSNDGSGIQGSTVITVDPVLVTSMGVQGQGGASNVLSGSSLQMLATVLPANATDGSVTWSVTNGTGTATINPSTGMLTGGSPGTVTVFATSNDGSGIQGSTVITVDPVLVTSMGVQGQGGATNVLSGSSLQMLATVLPANATDGSVTWSVTNGTGTATINPSTGMLTGGSPGTVTVFATSNDGSGIQGSTVITVNTLANLVISEIMYNGPEAGTDTTEFIEIYNNDVAAVDLTNYSLVGGNYTFPSVTLNPGEFYVVAINSVAFNNVFGFIPDGVFTGGLSNGGEFVTLKDALGNLVDSVNYDDASPWPSGVAAGEPDGGGSSIVLCDVNSDNNDGVNWNASVAGTGVIINSFEVKASPGVENFCCSMDVTPPTITCADTDTLYAGAGGCGVASSFVNVYYIPLSQMTFDGTGGPGCNPSLDVYSCGSDMTFTWTSLETASPLSVDIEFYQSYYNEGANSPTTFNGTPNNDYITADFSCVNNIINYSLNPTGYIVGGSNTLTISPSTDCIVLDENPDLSWDPNSYAKVTVVYGGGSVLTMPVVTDNCTVDTVYNDAPSILPVGTTNVTWTAMDANGNSNTCMQQVVVIDTIAPMITCPTDITLAADNGTCGFDVSTSFENVYYISLADISSDGVNGPDCNGTGNDAYSCDSVELSISWNSLETINPSNVQVEFYQSYYDVGGISSTTFNSIPNNDYVSTDGMCSNQVVNYNLDPSGYAVGGSNTLTIIPTINCIVLDENPDPSWAPQSYAKVTVSYGIGAASAADNCAIDTIYNDAPSVLPVGTTTVTWTATDVNGNSSTCDQQVTIEDLEAPTAVCQNINAYIDGSGNATIVASDLDGGSTDNCSGITFGASLTTFTCSDLGPNNVTLTVTDGNGNIDTCVSVVTVMDTIAPTISCPSDIIACVGDVVNFTAPAGADNCSQTVAQTDATGLASGMVFPTGVTTIEYTSTDGSGNTAVCSFNVTVSTIDISVTNTSPTLSANQTGASYQWLDCDNGNAIIPTEIGQTFTATVNGNYAVEITVGSCVDTSACENITGVGIKEAATNVVSIYPNPTNGLFTISLANTSQAVSYTITTLEGRIVEQANNVTANNIEVDLTNESKGIYFLVVKENNTSKTYKVIKQ
ncbi:Ig-like domain-containing protein [Vicingus serpentipes]|nr:Ig-like domain-containing protein [Vicingus serpentipes]